MRRWLRWIITAIGAITVLSAIVWLFLPAPDTGPAVGVIDVQGTIGEGAGPWETDAADPRNILDQIKNIARDGRIKAVVVRINSPGGSPAASQEIHAALTRLRADGIPLVASLGDTAASGGYYVALAAEKIVANPATTTGSIGVIIQVASIERLLDEWGVNVELLTSGRFKAVGSPFRPLTPEDREVLESTLRDIHDQFVEAVAASRGLSVERVRALADGRVYTGRQALDAGLVDELGGFEDAVRIARDMAGLGEDAPVIPFRRTPGVWERLIGVAAPGSRFRLPWGSRPAAEPRTGEPVPRPDGLDRLLAEPWRVFW